MNWIVNQHNYTAQRVFCIGRNYVEHIAELGNERPEQPVIFTKPATSLHPVSEPVIPLPRCGELPHYETEITVLVGTKGVPRTTEEAVTFIAGIGVGLDLTLRETQEKLLAHGLPWEICKGFDHSAPIGDFAPFSGTAETLAQLRFTGEINGELRQQGDSAKMIFSIPELLRSPGRLQQPEILHRLFQSCRVRFLHLRQRHSQRSGLHAHQVHGLLDRDGIHLAEKSLDQRDRIQLDLPAAFDIPFKELRAHIVGLARRDVGKHGDHALSAER